MDATVPEASDREVGPSRSGRRRWVIGLGVAGVLVAVVLAFGVFGVQTLFIDDTVDEAGPAFRSGATATTSAATAPDEAETGAGAEAETDAEVADAPQEAVAEEEPVVTEAARGGFAAVDHPGQGTAVILTDGQQSFVRFEDDFATDNGPDLFVVAEVAGERIELGRLKGNRGAQNYELPASVDPTAIDAVSVWCKRFDSTFTVAALS